MSTTNDSSNYQSPSLRRSSRTKRPKYFFEEDINEVSDEDDYCTGNSIRSSKRSRKSDESMKENASSKVKNKKKTEKVVSSDELSKTVPPIQTIPTNTKGHKEVLTYKYEFKGVIENFSSLSMPSQVIIKKPKFNGCLRIYPKGHPEKACRKDGICFFIKLSGTTITQLKYEVSLLNNNGIKIAETRSGSRQKSDKQGTWFGFCSIKKREKILDFLDKDEKLKIVCTFIVNHGTEFLNNLHELKHTEESCEVLFINLEAKAIDSIIQANSSDSGTKKPRSPLQNVSISSDSNDSLKASPNIKTTKLNDCSPLNVSKDGLQAGRENSTDKLNDSNEANCSLNNKQTVSEINAKKLNDCNQILALKDTEQTTSNTPSKPFLHKESLSNKRNVSETNAEKLNNCNQTSSENSMQTSSEPSVHKDLEKSMLSLPQDRSITQVIDLLSSFEYSHKWKVQNFVLSSCKNGEALSSPAFKVAQHANFEFQIMLYPNGCKQKCQDNICIDLECDDISEDDGDYEIVLLNSIESKAFDIKNALNSSSSCCIPKNKLMKFLENNELIIICLISTNHSIHENREDDEYLAQKLKNQLKVSSDLYIYKKEKDSCDIKLRVGDQDFYAHKTILATRSFTFRDPNIEILNEIKPLIFEEILHYIYTGKVLNFKESVYELFEATFKIDLPDLRIRCEKYLMENLSMDNVFQNLILADSLDADELKKEAKKFIVAFREQLANFPTFKAVRNLSSKLYGEIFFLSLSQDDP